MKHQVLKAYKFRIYPNDEQKVKLAQTFGCVRVVWNNLVENFNAYGTDSFDPKLNEKKIKENPDLPWLRDVSSVTLQQKRMDFTEFKKQYFNKKRKKKIGRPQFKTKTNRQSFRLTNQVSAFDQDTSTIKLAKIGYVKTVFTQEIPNDADFRSMTISKTPTGKYFVSILTKMDIETKPLTGRVVGIDLGVKDLFITSDSIKSDNPNWIRKNQAKLRSAQKHLSRKKKGSNRYHKQRIKVARCHEDVANARKDFHHKASTSLVENYDFISVEDLNTSGMLKNRKLSKAISNAGWYGFTSMLEYKAQWYGKTFVKIDRYFASTKTCSGCGTKTTLKLSQRHWNCSHCGSDHDRDVNAAINILQEGKTILTSAGQVDNRHGDAVSLGAFEHPASV